MRAAATAEPELGLSGTTARMMMRPTSARSQRLERVRGTEIAPAARPHARSSRPASAPAVVASVPDARSSRSNSCINQNMTRHSTGENGDVSKHEQDLIDELLSMEQHARQQQRYLHGLQEQIAVKQQQCNETKPVPDWYVRPFHVDEVTQLMQRAEVVRNREQIRHLTDRRDEVERQLHEFRMQLKQRAAQLPVQANTTAAPESHVAAAAGSAGRQRTQRPASASTAQATSGDAWKVRSQDRLDALRSSRWAPERKPSTSPSLPFAWLQDPQCREIAAAVGSPSPLTPAQFQAHLQELRERFDLRVFNPSRKEQLVLEAYRRFSEQLRWQEKQVLVRQRLKQYESVRGPTPGWYALRTTRFTAERRRNDRILAEGVDRPARLLAYEDLFAPLGPVATRPLTPRDRAFTATPKEQPPAAVSSSSLPSTSPLPSRASKSSSPGIRPAFGTSAARRTA